MKLVPGYIKTAIKNAPENLCFPGYIERDELCEAYYLFTFFSYEETEGIVVLEALACGIPALIGDIPFYEGWLTDRKTSTKQKTTRNLPRKQPAF